MDVQKMMKIEYKFQNLSLIYHINSLFEEIENGLELLFRGIFLIKCLSFISYDYTFKYYC